MANDLDREMRAGLARLREFWLNQAEAHFRRVLDAQPDHPSALHLMGVTACKLGRVEEGAAFLRRALELHPANTAARRDLDLAQGGATQGAGYSVDRAEHAFKLVDYDYRARVRYGAGRPAHPRLEALIGSGRERYAAFIADIAAYFEDYAAVDLHGDYASSTPFWINTWFPPLDGMALYAMLCGRDPALLVEIGSGISTKFARRAIAGRGLRARLVSIDPQPRNPIDRLADRTIRAPLEAVDPEVFDELAAGDILFLDSSHRALQNSDVTVFFLEVLPRLKPGVIVHLHDIYLPEDYPAGHLGRLWNEQYLLATALLYGSGLEVMFPCWYASRDAALAAQINAAVRRGPLAGLSVHGASFWLRKA